MAQKVETRESPVSLPRASEFREASDLGMEPAPGGFDQALLDLSLHPVWLLNTRGLVRVKNKAAIRTESLYPAGNGNAFPAFLAKLELPIHLADWLDEESHEEMITISGRIRHVSLRPLRRENEFLGYLFEIRKANSLLDISEENVVSLRQNHQELLSCLELSSDGFCIMDGETTILYANHVYEKITGLKREDIINCTMRELVRQGVFDRSVTEQILVTQKPGSLSLKLATGKTVLVSGNPLFDDHGEIRRIVCSIRDITELSRLQSELHSMGTLKTRYEEELVDLKVRSLGHEKIIFRSVVMRGILDLALRLKAVDSTILLQSESGSGKELLADFIQKNSLRAEKPFLKINCGAIPEALLESELFGYARGAFTGANREGKVGMFEAANGGTLLLDEVGDLPKALQVKLLRVLQERCVRRIGDTVPRAVDVRIIASTNRNLAEMVEQGDFREDLYYRLNVVPISIPPLRERKEDILPLIQAFLERFGKRYGTAKVLHPRVLSALLEYSWPGNVRELENITERMVVTSRGNTIDESELPDDLFHDVKTRLVEHSMEGKGLKELIDDYESKILRLFFLKYRTTRAVADALGIHQSNIVRKLQRLHLEELLETKHTRGKKAETRSSEKPLRRQRPPRGKKV